MAGIFPKKTNNPKPTLHQFIFVEAPTFVVSEQMLNWGESSWWPKDSLWMFVRLTDQPIRVGTKYTIKINKPSARDWQAEVSQFVPGQMIERKFTRGMFRGYERIRIEERANGTRVDYDLHVWILGLFDIFLWPFVLRKQYTDTISKILNALKVYAERKIEPHYEDATET